MRLPNDPKERKIIADKIINEVVNDQIRNIFSKINPYEEKEEFTKNIIDYFDLISRQVFDTFICEFGFSMEKNDYFNSVVFLHDSIYKWFVKGFVKDKRIKIWLEDKNVEEEFKNSILEISENSLFLFLCSSLFSLKNSDEVDKESKFENLACIIAILMRINNKYILLWDNATKKECQRYGKELKEKDPSLSDESVCIFMNDERKFYIDLMYRKSEK